MGRDRQQKVIRHVGGGIKCPSLGQYLVKNILKFNEKIISGDLLIISRGHNGCDINTV